MEEEILTAEAAETEAPDAEEKKIVNGTHNYSTEEAYVKPTDPKVLKKLEWFQDQKLGLMMHWGIYSLGVKRSGRRLGENRHRLGGDRGGI